MWTKLWKEVVASRAFVGPLPDELTTQDELDALPPGARALMKFAGVDAGKPKRWSFRAAWTGRFRRAPDAPWMAIEAAQYNLRLPVTRIFHMRARMNRVLPVLARDTYVEGRGHLRAKIADLLTVANGEGPELDQGELVTWLNDAVFFAPSMLLGSNAEFEHVDTHTFDVCFSDWNTTVTARVFVDDDGAPIDFETSDRFLEDSHDPKHRLVRGTWTTPIDARSGLYPSRAHATWHLADGDFTYAEFALVPGSLAFDVAPRDTNESVKRTATAA